MTEKQRVSLPANVLAISRANIAQKLAKIYSSVDVFLLFTRQDNYPTVCIEAESCGTLVIIIDVGKCKETIHRDDSRAVKALDEVKAYDLLIKPLPEKEEELSR